MGILIGETGINCKNSSKQNWLLKQPSMRSSKKSLDKKKCRPLLRNVHRLVKYIVYSTLRYIATDKQGGAYDTISTTPLKHGTKYIETSKCSSSYDSLKFNAPNSYIYDLL